PRRAGFADLLLRARRQVHPGRVGTREVPDRLADHSYGACGRLGGRGRPVLRALSRLSRRGRPHLCPVRQTGAAEGFLVWIAPAVVIRDERLHFSWADTPEYARQFLQQVQSGNEGQLWDDLEQGWQIDISRDGEDLVVLVGEGSDHFQPA